MKAIDLGAAAPNLDELLRLAAKENVILRTPDGKEFVLAELDDLDREIELINQNDGLTQLLAERSRGRAIHSSKQVKEKLGLK